jgi:adenine-specific DNA-methyltransferase
MAIFYDCKQDIIKDLQKRVDDKALERSNFDILKKFVEKSDSLTEAIAVAELGTTYKRTGFHFDKRLEKIGDTVRFLKKNNELSFSQDAPTTHKLIIGDNYHALLNLLVEYKGRIDVIYIDPPYGKDNMGEFAKTNYDNAITRDNLLSMLYPRLLLAKQLLNDSGVIFCSIDDKNQAYVECLFDEIFGEENFISNSILVNNRGGRDYGGIAKQHEYILIYSKTEDYELNSIEEMDKQFQYKDEQGGFNLMELRNRNIKFNDKNRPNLCYPFYVNPNNSDKNGLFEISLEEKDGFVKVMPAKSQGTQTVWRWGKEEKSRENLNREIFGKVNQNGGYMIVQKYRKTAKMQRSIWDDKEFVNERGTEILKELFDGNYFDYPKSVFTIKRILELSTNENSLILDFFAGSGTTGQAVLELNKEDGKKRKFILVQLPEDLDEALKNSDSEEIIRNQIELCDRYNRPHRLSEITAERLRRIMTGKCYDGTSDFKWIKENKALGGNLEVTEITNYANYKGEIFEKIDETLYGKEKFANIKEKIEWVCENFENTQKFLEEK